MKKKLMLVLCGAAVACSAWLAVNLYDSQTIKRGMPPGYYLECDRLGRYRACRNGRALFDMRDPSSKAAAIRRAWGQYEFESQLASEKWTRCNDR